LIGEILGETLGEDIVVVVVVVVTADGPVIVAIAGVVIGEIVDDREIALKFCDVHSSHHFLNLSMLSTSSSVNLNRRRVDFGRIESPTVPFTAIQTQLLLALNLPLPCSIP
jgi:hypothetical protein